MTNPRVRATRPDPGVYSPPKGLSRNQRAEEQDMAAGGRAARLVRREDGTTTTGSVALRCYHDSRRVYAYLRWSTGHHRTSEMYLGDVSDSPDRTTALHAAWSRFRDHSLTTTSAATPAPPT